MMLVSNQLKNSSRILSAILIISINSFAFADDESAIGSLGIESITSLNSAAYNKGMLDISSDEDKKRKAIGIGESIKLTATGKPLGEISELIWEITEGSDAITAQADT